MGDQLDLGSPVLADGPWADDCVWMAEVAEESTKVWSHKARIALFLSAMRHFAERLRERGWQVDYQALERHAHPDLGAALRAAIERHQPQSVRMVEAGEYGVARIVEHACAEMRVPLRILDDSHFLTTHADFDRWQSGRKQWVMEHFYREMRRKSGYLTASGEPVGGEWNLDKQNRRAFPKSGPGILPGRCGFPPDTLTRQVLELVERRFADHPGDLDAFAWPVTREQALEALADFIDLRLPGFGDYQDAMWVGESWLYHSQLAAALNLKLLDPREVLDAAVAAFDAGRAPLNAVEGFVRQILGWREYVRHLYWASMPGLLDENALDAHQPLPGFYWTGETEMVCLREALGQTLRTGYAHHIQRLMVTGLCGLLLGVEPRQMHAWYLAVYVDAVEWVEAPNTLGMSQFADGGRLGTKPYVASGRYIQRMSNYCGTCHFEGAGDVDARFRRF
nr:cryptochrome/photolyase family protein [Thiorhodococcus minor]